MPTKINSAGEQQNYVPAGNSGGGEYADYSSGSNKHFTNFSQDYITKEGSKKEPQPKKEVLPEYANVNGKGTKRLIDILKIKIGNKTKEKRLYDYLQSNKDINEEVADIIADFYSQKKCSLELGGDESYCSGYGTHIQLDVAAYNESNKDAKNYSKGGILFHETGHAIDYTYKGGVWSVDYISKKHNKSLNDMIYEEIRANVNKNDFINEYKNAREGYKQDEEYIKTIDEKSEIAKKRNEFYDIYLNDEELKKLEIIVDEKRDKYVWGEITREEFVEARNQVEKRRNLLVGDDSEYKKMGNRYEELQNKLEKIREKYEGEAHRKYGDLSDMNQASLDNYQYGMGHASNYFSNVDKRGKEAFAEIMSAKGTNLESYELMKKYIPKTLEIFDEIYKKIKKGDKE